MDSIGDQYIIKCRSNYFKGITPSNPEQINEKDYQELILIGNTYMESFGLEKFSRFFQEGQYFIDLWTAHLILRFAKTDASLKENSINKIKEYLDNPLAPTVSMEEKVWLQKHYPEYV